MRLSFFVAGVAGMLVACTSPPRPTEAPAAPPSAGSTRADQGRPAILVYYDMEGLSGQEDWRTAAYGHRKAYDRGRELLAADVNAVVDGLFAGGAGVVRVVDSHGSGYSGGPDLPPDRLDPRAEAVPTGEGFGEFGIFSLVKRGAYDGVVLVAMHSRTGRPGFMAHTFDLGTQVRLNGHWITESDGYAYVWGTVGVPVILVSGDDKLHEDLASMPWIEYVQVKRSVDVERAVARPVEEARRDLREAAERAVRHLGRMKPAVLATPVEVVVRAGPPASLTALEGVPGIAYADSGVTFTAPDVVSAFKGFRALLSLASSASSSEWAAVIAAQPNAVALQMAYLDTVVTRAFAYNWGRWRAAAQR